MNKKLGICITTFNRAEVLRDVLARMVPLARLARVAIYVNDNASTDDTFLVLQEFSREYEFFFPLVQDANVGFDRNFADCMARCDAEYCWGMADYSFIGGDAIQNILRIIDSGDYDFIALNNSNRVKRHTQGEYSDVSEVIRDIAWHITLLDSVVWRRKCAVAANFSRYDGSLFGYYGGLFEYISTRNFRMKWETSSYITGIHPKKQSLWYARAIDTWCVKWSNMIISLPYSLEGRRKFELIESHSRYSGLFSVKSMLSLRAEGYLNLSLLRGNLKSVFLSLSLFQIFIAVAVCFVPCRLLKTVKSAVLNK